MLDEALGYARGPSAATHVPWGEAQRDFPATLGVGTHFGKENHLRCFETGLDILLDWVDAQLL